MSLKCLIVDDEPLAIEILQSYVERVDSLELVDTCSNAVQAFDVLKKEKVDLLFLDIQMPKLTGIEFLKALNPTPSVIFTTAYREYAVESYELNVVDYLLKPIAFDRFLMAINKVVENGNSSTSEMVNQVVESGNNSDPFLFLKVDRKMVKVYLKEITYIESLKDYVRVNTEDGKELVSLQKISYLEKKLPSDCFVRTHKSYIISLKKISAYTNSAIEVGGTEVPIGRSYKSEVVKVLKDQV
ncbi:LytR/AlgR family response regulator transcription factor [Ekhidna sp. To15]|uniref:LytR/AlgR family response regulator transcription factor n=1 Tax=Ekhidna sp. To15 TaxID=3395267 RepID=UPI003F525B09